MDFQIEEIMECEDKGVALQKAINLCIARGKEIEELQTRIRSSEAGLAKERPKVGRDAIYELIDQGLTRQAAADQLGCSVRTVYRALKERSAAEPVKPAEPIDLAKLMQPDIMELMYPAEGVKSTKPIESIKYLINNKAFYTLVGNEGGVLIQDLRDYCEADNAFYTDEQYKKHIEDVREEVEKYDFTRLKTEALEKHNSLYSK